MNRSLYSLIQIARLVGVSPAALSNWQRRYDNFPKPAEVQGNRRLYRLDEVQEFIEVNQLGLQRSSSNKLKENPEIDIVSWTIEEIRRFAPVGIDPILLAASLAGISSWDKQSLLHLADKKVREKLIRSESALEDGLKILDSIPVATRIELLDKWISVPEKVDSRRFAMSLRSAISFGLNKGLNAENISTESLAELMSQISPGLEVLNICSGVGTVLKQYGRKVRRLVGQEVNASVANLSRLLARLEQYEVKIYTEDALAVCHPEWMQNCFDSVIVDLPHTMRLREDVINPKDLRWTNSQSVRHLRSDDFWVMSVLAYLRPSLADSPFRGVLALRGNWFYNESGQKFRELLVKSGVIEAVIALGDGLHAGSSLHTTLLVVNKTGVVGSPIRMIDARLAGQIIGRKRLLTRDEISLIVRILNSSHPNSSTESTISVIDVSPQDVIANGAVLEPQRYVVTNSPTQPLEDLLGSLNETSITLQNILADMTQLIKRVTAKLTNEALFSTSLVDIEFFNLFESENDDHALSSLIKNRRMGEKWSTDEIHTSDVVVCILGSPTMVGAAVSGSEFVERQLNWQRVLVLRSKSQKVTAQYLLTWAKYGGLSAQIAPLVTGSTIRSVARRDLDRIRVPIPPMPVQMKIAEYGLELDNLQNQEIENQKSYSIFLDFLLQLTGQLVSSHDVASRAQ